MDDSARLRHILDTIERVARYTAGGRGQFMADELVQDAVMRNFEIIGEAAKALSSETTVRAPTVAWRIGADGSSRVGGVDDTGPKL